jgi:hypothetical protein
MTSFDKYGESKQGAGRVAMFTATKVPLCLTLECNYNGPMTQLSSPSVKTSTSTAKSIAVHSFTRSATPSHDRNTPRQLAKLTQQKLQKVKQKSWIKGKAAQVHCESPSSGATSAAQYSGLGSDATVCTREYTPASFRQVGAACIEAFARMYAVDGDVVAQRTADRVRKTLKYSFSKKKKKALPQSQTHVIHPVSVRATSARRSGLT